MVDKLSGQVAYVVMTFGGFLGIGDSYDPLPWKSLTYDTRRAATSSILTDRGSKALQATRRTKTPGRKPTTVVRSMTTMAWPTLTESPAASCRM